MIRPTFTHGEGRGFLIAFWAGGYIDRLWKCKPIIPHGDGTTLWTSCHTFDVALRFLERLILPEFG